MGRVRRVYVAWSCSPCSGSWSGGGQSTLSPTSHQEREISELFWIMLAVGLGRFRAGRGTPRASAAVRRRRGLPFGGGEKAGTALIVPASSHSDIFVIKSTAAPDSKSTQRRIQIFGHRRSGRKVGDGWNLVASVTFRLRMCYKKTPAVLSL